ncbi:MAG: stage II sporulation protein R [Oscillospiraceae bacterium]
MSGWRKLEVSLLVGLAVSLLFGGRLNGAQTALADKMVRLHVIANSDSPWDQTVKLMVRDRMLEEVGGLLDGETDLEQAKEKIQEALPKLARAGQEVALDAGDTYPVTASLERTFFPTKEYEGFALPAGEYTALRIVLGEGAGKNWWCVLFPPLCTGVATEEVEDAAAAAGLTDEEIALITEQEEGYIFRFRCIEWWAQIKHIFC